MPVKRDLTLPGNAVLWGRQRENPIHKEFLMTASLSIGRMRSKFQF